MSDGWPGPGSGVPWPRPATVSEQHDSIAACRDDIIIPSYAGTPDQRGEARRCSGCTREHHGRGVSWARIKRRLVLG